jgi:hypothetical protein
VKGIPAPTPAEQIEFLGNIERVLSEGQFVATYKYAMLVAIADLAVQMGSDNGEELELPVKQIAEKFIELYWRQSAPYGHAVGDGEFGILIQNSGRQASVISIVAGLRKSHGTLTQARQSRAWSGVVSKTERIIEEMPLWRLQLLRAGPLEFLYVRSQREGNIRLKAGVAANLRRFHGMVLRLAQSEWLRFVQTLPSNASLLGATSDLGQFLFGAERSALNRMVEPLREAQQGCCFYCERQIVTGEIDHFVPWSRYQRDLAHNLVLAHIVCNRKKSDLLADERHLERWIGRNRDRDAIIVQAGGKAGIIIDLTTTLSVARWAYAQGEYLRSGVWSGDDHIEPLSGRWRTLLGT